MSDNDGKFVIVNGAGDRVLTKHRIMVSLDAMMKDALHVPVFFDTPASALAHAAKDGLNQFVHAETMADFIADNAGMELATDRRPPR